jgi:hypothetical protein
LKEVRGNKEFAEDLVKVVWDIDEKLVVLWV